MSCELSINNSSFDETEFLSTDACIWKIQIGLSRLFTFEQKAQIDEYKEQLTLLSLYILGGEITQDEEFLAKSSSLKNSYENTYSKLIAYIEQTCKFEFTNKPEEFWSDYKPEVREFLSIRSQI